MIKNKLWKLESNDKLNMKLDKNGNLSTPIDLYHVNSITDSDKE